MFSIVDYYENARNYFDNMTKRKHLKDAIKVCQQKATEFQQANKELGKDIQLLDYERTYKSERLAYGVYCIDKELHKVIKEYRVYDN